MVTSRVHFLSTHLVQCRQCCHVLMSWDSFSPIAQFPSTLGADPGETFLEVQFWVWAPAVVFNLQMKLHFLQTETSMDVLLVQSTFRCGQYKVPGLSILELITLTITADFTWSITSKSLWFRMRKAPIVHTIECLGFSSSILSWFQLCLLEHVSAP